MTIAGPTDDEEAIANRMTTPLLTTNPIKQYSVLTVCHTHT